MYLTALTAIQITHLIMLASFNNEIFLPMSNRISVIEDAFFGAKLYVKYVWMIYCQVS